MCLWRIGTSKIPQLDDCGLLGTLTTEHRDESHWPTAGLPLWKCALEVCALHTGAWWRWQAAEIHPVSDPQGWSCVCPLESVRFSLPKGTGNLPTYVLCKDASFQRGPPFLICRKAPYKLEAALAGRQVYPMDQMWAHRRECLLGIILKGIYFTEPPSEESRLQGRTCHG